MVNSALHLRPELPIYTTNLLPISVTPHMATCRPALRTRWFTYATSKPHYYATVNNISAKHLSNRHQSAASLRINHLRSQSKCGPLQKNRKAAEVKMPETPVSISTLSRCQYSRMLGAHCNGATGTYMRILIRDRSGPRFLADGDRWVTDMHGAHNFQSSVAAINYLSRRQITGVDLWYAFPNSQYDFKLPLAA